MSDATVLHGGPIYEGELAVLIKAHIWGVHWLFGCYDFGPKTAKTQLAAAFACISVELEFSVFLFMIVPKCGLCLSMSEVRLTT